MGIYVSNTAALNAAAASACMPGNTCWYTVIVNAGLLWPRRSLTTWARLAEAREPIDPAAAMGVYLRLVESTLTKADKRASASSG